MGLAKKPRTRNTGIRRPAVVRPYSRKPTHLNRGYVRVLTSIENVSTELGRLDKLKADARGKTPNVLRIAIERQKGLLMQLVRELNQLRREYNSIPTIDLGGIKGPLLKRVSASGALNELARLRATAKGSKN
jgi:hypothetical protein